MENVTIIGTGCAGLTAAIYTARANLNPLVLTGTMPGGLLTTTSIVENFPGFPEGIDGFELMQNLQKQAERFGAKIQFGTVDACDLSGETPQLKVDGKPLDTRTLIIATGAGHRHLGLENEAKLENKGVTYCATCDGALPMFRDKPLVVVGGVTPLVKRQPISRALLPRCIWFTVVMNYGPARSWRIAPLGTRRLKWSGIRW